MNKAKETELQAKLQTATWRKSKLSGDNGACVEVAFVGSKHVAVRDSKNPDASKLLFAKSQWQAFLKATKSGQFDLKP